MSDKQPIILAAGGTGGHIFPAVALAEVLRARGFDPQLVTDHRFHHYNKGSADGVLAWFVAKKKGGADAEHDPGSLFASGLIAGEALMGISLAVVVVVDNLGYVNGLVDHMKLREPDANRPVRWARYGWALAVTAASTAACVRPFTMTRAPSAARPAAMACPMPAVLPDTSASLPVSCMSMSHILYESREVHSAMSV